MDMVTSETQSAAGSLMIAPHEEALTFARIEQAGACHLLLVAAYGDDALTGVDLTAVLGGDIDDPIKAYRRCGYEGLSALALRGPVLTVPLAQLVVPVALTSSHIAVGTNFPEHANESTVKDGPFLFPKEVTPTGFNAPISVGKGLIDYEVELCFVALDDLDLDEKPDRVGLVLCNDVTDRAALLRHIDPRNIVSGKGFTTGKSAPGYMPLGTLFVIPRDLRAFAARVELRLFRNGVLKQSARQLEAIWDFDELLRQTKARRLVKWDFQGRSVSLALVDGAIPARTGLLGGTPSGTIFQGLHKSAIARGVFDWAAGGWSKPLTHWIIERQIAMDKASGRYLQPGENIHIRADYLGELRNTLVD